MEIGFCFNKKSLNEESAKCSHFVYFIFSRGKATECIGLFFMPCLCDSASTEGAHLGVCSVALCF